MSDCIHNVRLCPDCGGLQTQRMNRLGNVYDFTLTLVDGSTISSTGPVELYVGPVYEECDTAPVEAP